MTPLFDSSALPPFARARALDPAVHRNPRTPLYALLFALAFHGTIFALLFLR